VTVASALVVGAPGWIACRETILFRHRSSLPSTLWAPRREREAPAVLWCTCVHFTQRAANPDRRWGHVLVARSALVSMLWTCDGLLDDAIGIAIRMSIDSAISARTVMLSAANDPSWQR